MLFLAHRVCIDSSIFFQVDGQFVEEFSNKDVTVKKLNNRESEIIPDSKCGIFFVRFDSTNVKVRLNKYLWRGKVNGKCLRKTT